MIGNLIRSLERGKRETEKFIVLILKNPNVREDSLVKVCMYVGGGEGIGKMEEWETPI